MNFKKDYINYVLYNVLNSHLPAYSAHGSGMDYPLLADNPKLKKILEKVINNNDIVKMTFLIGKTAGLEYLFKYLLYISDKIDKSQITIFNLKENFEYDVINLKKICEKIEGLASGQEDTRSKPEQKQTEVSEKEITPEPEIKPSKPAGTIKIDIKDEKELIEPKRFETDEEAGDDKEEEPEGLTLIENAESGNTENEVFELSSIDETEESEKDEKTETDEEAESIDEAVIDEDAEVDEELIIEEKETAKPEEEFELETLESEVENKKETPSAEDRKETEPEVNIPVQEEVEEETFEFEVKEPEFKDEDIKQTEPLIGETVTKEAYIKFETRFFEDVKILEKLFAYINKEIRIRKIEKLSDRMLQSFTEIIEISSELSDHSRQLSFDLTADIFFTINMFFARAIKNPLILSEDRIKLLDSSLVLVNSIIKNEDYLNFDELAEQIEKLKDELTKPAEKKSEPVKIEEAEIKKEPEPIKGKIKEETAQQTLTEKEDTFAQPVEAEEIRAEEAPPEKIIEPAIEEPAYRLSGDEETVMFKMKHFVKEFEKIFESVGNIRGEYSKFDALEKIDDMNYCMRMLAKTAASAGLTDVLKLSEVSYVFLKYVKDYRMDMQDSEIQQVIKYIIITFKILIKGRKTEDFNIFVEYLNTPVKIFTDSN